MTIEEKVGRAIVQFRKEKGLSQEQFAYEAQVARRYMSDIENGKRQVSLNVIYKVCQHLGISMAELFSAAEEMED